MIKSLAAAIAVCLLLSTAALAEGSYYTELPTADVTSSMNITLNMPGENPVIDGVNPLTGESYNGSYTPILVNIDTNELGWPHWGLSSADIVYEMPLHSNGTTRVAALFLGDIPPYAGPVRSGRVPMGSIREMWDSAWVFFGWQNGYDGKELEVDVDTWARYLHPDSWQHGRWVFPFVEGTQMNYASFFHRQNDADHVAPHNVQVDMNEVRNLFYSTGASPQQHPFKFTQTGLDYGTDVSHILVNYREAKGDSYISEYEYNPLTGLYERYRNGQQDYDALTGDRMEYANVIVLRTNVTYFNGNPSRPVIQLVGQGVADIFQNGKYIRGSWARGASSQTNETNLQDLASRMVFFDDNGQELEMKVGKTYIHIVDNKQAVVVTAGQQVGGGIPQTAPEPTPTPEATRTPRPTRTPRADSTPAPAEEEEQDEEEEDENADFDFGA